MRRMRGENPNIKSIYFNFFKSEIFVTWSLEISDALRFNITNHMSYVILGMTKSKITSKALHKQKTDFISSPLKS